MEELLTEKAVCKLTKLSRTTVWRWERKGKFPARRKVGEGKVAWLASEIKDWILSLEQKTSHKEVQNEF